MLYIICCLLSCDSHIPPPLDAWTMACRRSAVRISPGGLVLNTGQAILLSWFSHRLGETVAHRVHGSYVTLLLEPNRLQVSGKRSKAGADRMGDLSVPSRAICGCVRGLRTFLVLCVAQLGVVRAKCFLPFRLCGQRPTLESIPLTLATTSRPMAQAAARSLERDGASSRMIQGIRGGL